MAESASRRQRIFATAALGLPLALLPAAASAEQAPSFEQMLELPFAELMKVVVSASSRGQPLREAPATIHVITSEQIAERGYQTLEDALHDLPGIDFVHVGGAFPTIFAPRGAYGDENRRILLLVDGQIENSLNGAFEMVGPAYSLYGVERVEVVFGPASALYGANAFSGIINLISKRPGEQPQFNYRRSQGSFNSGRDDLFLSGPLTERWSLSLSGTRLRSDGPRLDAVIAGYSDGYVDDALGWNARLRHRGEHSDSVFGVHGSDTPTGNGTFGNTPTRFLGLPPRSDDNPGLGGFYHADLGGQRPGLWHPYTQTSYFEHAQRFGDKWQARARLSYQENGLHDDSYSFSVNRSRTALSKFHGAYDSRRAGIDLQLGYAPDARSSTTVGLQHYRNDLEKGYRTVVPDPAVVVVDGIALTNINATFRPRDAVQSTDVGVYFEHQRKTDWLRDTSFTVGARYDSNSLYGNSFNPRLGLVNHPKDRWTLKLLYGSAFRAPTPFELYSTSPVRVANPDLQPERLKAWEFVASREGAQYLLQATAFYNRLSDVIVEGIPVGAGQTQIQNAAQARVRGLTGSWDYRPVGAFKLYANASWQDAEQETAAGRFAIANVARLKANAGAQWNPAEFGQLHLAARWVGERSVSPSNPLERVPGYIVLDAHVLTKPLWQGRLLLSASVRNLADRHYTDPGIRTADGTSFSPELEQPGRSYWLSIELRL